MIEVFSFIICKKKKVREMHMATARKDGVAVGVKSAHTAIMI